jgi:biopolymer transport protein ExbB/TolQ
MEPDIVSTSTEILERLGSLGSWLQAIGAVVVLWLAFEIVSLIINRRKMRQIIDLKNDLKRLEKKVDKLTRKLY